MITNKRQLENMLRRYPMMSQLITTREYQLKHPHKAVDENMGGGRAENVRDESVERMVATVIDDPLLAQLHEQEDTIAECLQETDPITYAIIDELYFAERRSFNQAGLAFKLNIHERTVRKYRDKFLDLLDSKLLEKS